MIARSMRAVAARMPGYHVDVIDLGLFYEEAVAMGLQTETRTRTAELPAELECGPEARAAFTERKVGARKWEATRVELNAFTSPQLVDYIEERLERHGATGKVVPPPDVLEQRYREEVRSTIGQRILSDFLARAQAEMDRQTEAVYAALDEAMRRDVATLDAAVGGRLREEPALHWETVVRRLAATRVGDGR
jgi:hypothetical protein